MTAVALVIAPCLLCVAIGEAALWLLRRRRHTAVRRDMAEWDAERAEEERRMRENDARADREFAEELRRMGV